MPVIDDPEVYRAVLDTLLSGVYLVDHVGKILFWNAGAERITGYRSQDVVGRSTREDFLGHVDGNENVMSGDAAPLAAVLREGKAIKTEVSLRHRAGHRIPVRLHVAPIRNAHGSVIGAVENFEESIAVADWDRRQDKLAAYGCLDASSGVLNHEMVEAHLRESLATFDVHPIPFCILCIAIDQLATIKTRNGQAAMSAVLKMVGSTLENGLRPTDSIGRWQENEFLVVLPECNADESTKIADRLRRMVGQCKIQWWGDALPVTVSLGAAEARAGDKEQTILQRAERALRESGAQGGNRLVVFDGMKLANS